MKKSLFGLVILLILLTTYKPNFNLNENFFLNINKVEIEIKNNSIIKIEDIRNELRFIYSKNLFFLDLNEIEKKLAKETLIQNIIIKKIYPFKLKIIITEKKILAIVQDKKKKYYITKDGILINFISSKKHKDLPIVFGNGKKFYTFYKNLEKINFPIKKIKSFYFFESGRWDLLMNNDTTVKLPVKEYISSLKNFISAQENSSFDVYKVFDYRVKDQLILN